MKKVYIASRNPVKINCVRTGVERCFPYVLFQFEGATVSSGVSDQPMSDNETYSGAFNRAQALKDRMPDGEFWVGIEGGLEERDGVLEAFAWVVVLGKYGQGKARTSSFFLPEAIAELIRKGIELGEATDVIFNKDGSKLKSGAVGVLTKDLINRTEYYEQAVVLALIPFMNPHLYPVLK
jgi:inosine/xanthosine triphosphatase